MQGAMVSKHSEASSFQCARGAASGEGCVPVLLACVGRGGDGFVSGFDKVSRLGEIILGGVG